MPMYLRQGYLEQKSYLPGMGDLNQSLLPAEKRIYSQVKSMSPSQRDKTVADALALYRKLPPEGKQMVNRIRERLRQSDFDPRAAPGLGVSAAASVTSTMANVTQMLTAVAGGYLAYEGLREQRRAREAQDRRASEDAAARRRIEEQEAQRRQEEFEMQQRLFEQQLSQPAQPGVAPAAPGAPSAPATGKGGMPGWAIPAAIAGAGLLALVALK